MRPISLYIDCINNLKLPYPSEYLENFLTGYRQNFTRDTNIYNILFDGKKNVKVDKISSKMSIDDIEHMLMELVKWHPMDSDIYKKFLSATRDLIRDAKSVQGLKTPFKINDYFNRHKEILSLIKEKVNANKNKNVPNIEEKDIIDILSITNLSPETISGESNIIEMVKDIWSSYKGSSVVVELSTWPSLFEKMNETNEKILEILKSKLVTLKLLKNSPYHSPFSSKNIIHNYEKEIIEISKARISAILSTEENPKIENNVKGMFKNLLATHNTSLDTALNMFLGNFGYIRGVEMKYGRNVPYARGAQFRMGVDSQYGDVIFIMKPSFWKNYKYGVSISENGNQIVDGVVFNDFWKGKQMKYQEAENLIKKEAQNFGFREPKVESVDCSTEYDRKNLTWCNIQLHVGENVRFEDVDVVLVPNYLILCENGKYMFEGNDVKNILLETNINKKYKNGSINPFCGKLIYYGNTSGSHYALISKSSGQQRHPIYDEILKDHPAATVLFSKEEDKVVKNALHRSRALGNSSTIALSKLAFIEAQQEYMFRLLNYNMVHKNDI